MPQKRQKILLLPPMKGLNLFDNPFTMDAQFAEALTNFMPPTTELKVRPGIKKLTEIFGAVRGMYSYSVGTTKSYGQNWYDQTISDGEYQSLLLKFLENSGSCAIYAFNPLSNSLEIIQRTDDTEYTNDYAIYKHSLMMCTGKTNLPMYIWSSRIGWKNMKWVTPDNTEITDLQNITFYNGMCLANASNTFDIFICDAAAINPTDSSSWDKIWAWFSPKSLGKMQISLEGVAKKGGSIMKMFTLSKSGIETINSYFCVCTTMGEIIVWQGTLQQPSAQELASDPNADPTPNFILVGRFEIPIPLNKDCFCQMEGDIVVATQNGLFSLNRVIFGQQTEITQSLETRIQNVFNNYMFKDNAYQKFFGLYYYQKNRLLIFNTPARMPQPLNLLKEGFSFGQDSSINLKTLTTTTSSGNSLGDDPSIYDQTIEALKSFIAKYLFYNWLDYTVYYQFNNSYSSVKNNLEGIFLDFQSELQSDTGDYAVKTSVDFYIQIINESQEIQKIRFLANPLIFSCPNFSALSPVITLENVFEWNSDLLRSYTPSNSNEIYSYYSFNFKQYLQTKSNSISESEVTNIIPVTSFFASPYSDVPIFRMYPGNPKILQIKKLILSTIVSDEFLPNFPPNIFSVWFMMGQSGYPDGEMMANYSKTYFADSEGEPHYSSEILKNMNGYLPFAQQCVSVFANTYSAVPQEHTSISYCFKILITTQSGKEDILNFVIDIEYWYDGGAQGKIIVSADFNGVKIPCKIDTNVSSVSFQNCFYYFRYAYLPGISISGGNTAGNVSYSRYLIDNQDLADYSNDPVVDVSIKTLWTGGGAVPQKLYEILPEFTVTENNYEEIAKKYGWLISPFQVIFSDVPPTPPTPPTPPITDAKSACSLIVSDTFQNLVSFKGILTNFPISSFSFPYDSFFEIFIKIQNGIVSLFSSGDAVDSRSIADAIDDAIGEFSFIVGDFFRTFYSQNQDGYSCVHESVLTLDFEKNLFIKFRTTFIYSSPNSYDIFCSLLSQEGGRIEQPVANVVFEDGTVENNLISLHVRTVSYERIFFNNGTKKIKEISLLFKPISMSQFTCVDFFCNWTDDSDNYIKRCCPIYWKPIVNDNEDNVQENFEIFTWTFFLFFFLPEDASIDLKKVLMPERKKITVDKSTHEKIKAYRQSKGDAPSPTYAIQNANFDFSSLPVLNNSDVLCNYNSTQYVFNSYYGTWSSWKNVNMIHGASHLGEFYFIIPKDIPEMSVGTNFTYNTSVICKFDDMIFGDEDLNFSENVVPISVSYQTPSNNLGVNQYKLLNRIKIFGTQPTFWGEKANTLKINLYSDFVASPAYYYQHTSLFGKERILEMMAASNPKIKMLLKSHRRANKKFRDFNLDLLSYQERKIFNKLYLVESSNIRSVDMGVLCAPANRVAIQVSMNIVESNIIIYGYELYLQIMDKV